MENVPWHKDVVAFAQAIAQRLKEKAATVGYVIESILPREYETSYYTYCS